MKEVEELLAKYDYFRDAQIRAIESTSDDSKKITFVTQDDDGEDVDSISIEFKGIKEARILQNHVLAYLDMMSGVSIIKENDLYGFGIGSGTTMLHVHNAPLYVIAEGISID